MVTCIFECKKYGTKISCLAYQALMLVLEAGDTSDYEEQQHCPGGPLWYKYRLHSSTGTECTQTHLQNPTNVPKAGFPIKAHHRAEPLATKLNSAVAEHTPVLLPVSEHPC